MTTYVLVHGAWVGGWYWGRVKRALADAGHVVFTPTLTGCGERVHLAGPEVGLETHIQDVVGVLEYEDLHRVVIVGHGYGGMVATGAAEGARKRLFHAVYLNAHVPQDGESAADLAGPEVIGKYEELARAQGDGWRIPMPMKLEQLGFTSEVDIRWVSHRLTPQSLKSLTQPIALPRHEAASMPRTFIHCTRQPMASFAKSVARARGAGWRFRELDAPHGAPVTHPKEVARLLLEIVPKGYQDL